MDPPSQSLPPSSLVPGTMADKTARPAANNNRECTRINTKTQRGIAAKERKERKKKTKKILRRADFLLRPSAP
jgi:hypothetical protein